MASTIIEALFTAKETISDALNNADRATESFDRTIGELNLSMALAEARSEGAEQAFDELATASGKTSSSTKSLKNSLGEVSRILNTVDTAADLTESEMEALTRAMGNANLAADVAKDGTQGLSRAFSMLKQTGALTEEQLDEIRDSLTSASAQSQVMQGSMLSLNQMLFALHGASQAAQSGLDEVGDEASQASRDMTEASASAGMLSGQLGFLSAIAKASSFEFSSLSVNIGPFNVALRNILVQLPMILTGMGSLLAVVISLGSAFAVLSGAIGAAFLGGAIAQFQEFSGQFEESGEAVEAFMQALQNLFAQAIEPLMSEANMDLFVDSVTGAARVVNRFAQFFNQMRSEALDFLSRIGGDMEAFFESLHDSFVLVEDDLLAFINFFVDSAPGALLHFAEVTDEMVASLGPMVDAFTNLFNQLIDFAQILLSAVAPVIVLVVQTLASFFNVINSVNDQVLKFALQLGALLVVFVKLRGMVTNLVAGFQTLISVTKIQAAAGSFLANTYFALGQAISGLIFGNMTLSQSMTMLRKNMLLNTAVTRANIKSKFAAIASNISAAASYLGLSGAINAASLAAGAFWSVVSLGIIPAIAGLIAIIAAVVAVVMNWGGIMDWLTGIVDTLKSAIVFVLQVLAAVFIPILNVIIALFQAWGQFIGFAFGKLGKFINRLLEMSGIMEGLGKGVSFFEKVLDWLGGWNDLLSAFIQKLNMIPGVDIGGPAIDVGNVQQQLEGEQSQQATDDISTNPNVNLSFRDELNQQVDVQADPEDREGLKRIVKDAMNEANSIARRSEGVGR